MAATATADNDPAGLGRVWELNKESPNYESLRNRLVERYMPLVQQR